MSIEKIPLILVDGSSYLYRAFHAMPALTNSKGRATGAIYGVTNMLRRLLMDYQPESIAVIFDAKGKTFRDDLYRDYKANRTAMPQELIEQIEPIHDIIRAMGLPLLVVDGVEADDVIGTLTHQANQAGLSILISTGDKDLAQLVNEQTALINTMTNLILNPCTVKEKFDVHPEQMIDYLTLVGDTSDNIPGVPKVGPKTAAKWLQEYGSLDNIICHAEKISGKVGENLRGFLNQIPLTKQLVTIKLDVSLPVTIADLHKQAADNNKLITLFKEFEFKSWLAELLVEKKEDQHTKYQTYETIYDEKTLDQWVALLQQVQRFTFDTETTSLDCITAKLVGFSFAIAPGKAVYIPFGHDYLGVPAQLTEKSVLQKCAPLLENPQLQKIGQNSKYDMEVLANYGIQLRGIVHDTMLMSYVLDSANNSHDLDSLALKYLGWRTITFKEITGTGAKQLTFNHVEVEKASTYAAEDADVVWRLYETLLPRVYADAGLKHIYENIEIPLISVLARMERYGVLIDPLKLEIQGKELTQELLLLEKEAYQLAGQSFNINSPKQLQEILFGVLKLPILQKTPTGQPSTADNVLQELALSFTLPQIIIRYRSLSKLISTYTSRLVKQINPQTGRVHTSYNQSGTATGRLSSSEPNLQNIPIRTAEGRRIRQAFIAPPGFKMVSADYSQIELRLMAHIAHDPQLISAFERNLDIHKATAAEVSGVTLEQVTPEMRRAAKAINFGLIYGMSAFGLAKQLGIDRQAALTYIERYFARYPQVKIYMENTRQMAKEKGYVETLWGRRLYLPEINSTQVMRQKAAERAAINAPLQGSAADIIKLAMLQIDRWLYDKNIAAKMIMQVHDELVFEVAEQDLADIVPEIQRYMSEVIQLKVPIQVSVGIGNNWDEASAH